MNEIEIYDRNGLFHNIVKKSSIMKGRYHVLHNGTTDLNSNTISGIELPSDNFPLVGCLTPSSIVNASFERSQWEKFSFRLLFLCTSFASGDNQLKGRDNLTNTSLHTISKDWNDMKDVALSFMHALEITSSKLRKVFLLDDAIPVRINRITQIESNKLSGVILTFGCMIATACNYQDISSSMISTIEIPSDVHTTHKH